MATKDFSTIPAIVTITNNAEPRKAYDAGAIQLADPSAIQTDEHGKYVLTNADRQVQLYKINQFVTIPSGDSLKVVAETSEEVAYFASLANDEIAVAIEAAESAESAGD